MAYDALGLQINRGVTTANGQGEGTSVIHTYINLNDTIAVIEANGYFPDFFVEDSLNPNIPEQTAGENIKVNDYLFIRGSDGARITVITDLEPVVISASILMPNTLSVSSPIAAIDNNGLSYSGGVLRNEFADATHNGIISTVNQNIGGEKFFADLLTAQNGIDVTAGAITTPTLTANTSINTLNLIATNAAFNSLIATTVNVGASASNLTFFSNDTFISNWVGPWGATVVPATLNLTKINNKVFLSISGITAIPATVVSPIMCAAVLPLIYIPINGKVGLVPVVNNSANQLGSISISGGTGVLTIYSDLGSTPFAAAGNAGFFDISFMYDKTT
jgi:hypothetical protein